MTIKEQWSDRGVLAILVVVAGGVFLAAGLDWRGAEASASASAAASQDPAAIFAVLPDRMPGAEEDTPELVELGRELYFETALSGDGSMSCNTCHRIDEELAGTDYQRTSKGVRGNMGPRNSPTTLNAGYQMGQFWDARAKDLQEQAGGPPLNPIEMAMPDSAAAEQAVRAVPHYREAFAAVFPGEAQPVTFENTMRAIAAFERTLRTPARLDAYLEGDHGALTGAEVRGMQTYVDVGCGTCHRGALLGGDRMMKMGQLHPYHWSDDEGAGGGLFKVAQLRNVTMTPPYFHDGQAETIAEAVERMAWLQLGRELESDELLDILRFLTATADVERTVEDSWPEEGWWQPPSPGAVPEGEVAYGLRLLRETPTLLGLDGGTAGHAVGNDLSCTHCHQDQGVKRYGIPWVGVTDRYPTFRGRSGAVKGLDARINGCFERSMNGQPLDPDSREMKAMQAYFAWLSENVPEKMEGAGTPEFDYPHRRADLEAGHTVYMGKCQSCHGPNGDGYENQAGLVIVPPLWGERSYNEGAGMTRVLTAAPFIQANMPLGAPYNRPALSAEESFDVAAFMNSHERPIKTEKNTDYPNLLDKPIDAPYPPYADEYPVDQHRFGPFGPIERAHERMKQRTDSVPNPYVAKEN